MTHQAETTSYQAALTLIQNLTAFGIEPSLEGVIELMHWLGDPQLSYPSIQIAGTNGKTSTARFTAAFLRSQGYKVGLYTSPELVEYRERMEVEGAVVSKQGFAAAISAAWAATGKAVDAGVIWGVTEFELVTAAALWLFAREQVDFAVLEVGLGGRWDATSVVSPKVAVITGIGLDHMAILGDTIEKIAAEKAAIIKAGSIPVLGSGTKTTREVFLARCDEVGAATPIIVEDTDHCEGLRIDPSRFPSYQKPNIACALAATRAALGEKAVGENAVLVERSVGKHTVSGENIIGNKAVSSEKTHVTLGAPVVSPVVLSETKNPADEPKPYVVQSNSTEFTLSEANASGVISAKNPADKPKPPIVLSETKNPVLELLNMDAIQKVLDTLCIPGRFELLREQPPLLIDASHNPQSAQVLADALRDARGIDKATGYLKGFDTLLLGILADKDAEGIIEALVPLFKNLAVTQSSSPRAIPAGELAERVRQITGRDSEVFTSVPLALEVLSQRGAAVVATGSITVAGEVKRWLIRDFQPFCMKNGKRRGF